MTRNRISFVFGVVVLLVIPPAVLAAEDRCSPRIQDNASAAGVCTEVCASYGMVYAGNWSNDPKYPPVKACIDSGAGQAVCGCAPGPAPEPQPEPAPAPAPAPEQTGVVVTPTVEVIDVVSPPRVPIGLKATCLQGPDSSSASESCPIIAANGINFWALSYADNRLGMAVVGYDSAGNVVALIEKTGARYVWDITLDATSQTITLHGQGDQTITLNWTDLFVSQMDSGATTSNYVIWPTATSGQAWWTNGARNYGAAAPYGAGTGQLLDPYVEHAAGNQLCSERQQPWYDFVAATVASPYSTVTCILPPAPGQPTYNAAMNTLLSAAVNDHGLMSALSVATTDDQLIAAAADKGYAITSADIAQSRGQTSAATNQTKALAATATATPACGGADQKPCSKCTQEFCAYFPFNFCCIKEQPCSCQKWGDSCASGLKADSNNLCEPACPVNQICKDFPVFYEYNDNGTAANGVCDSWLHVTNCEKGIPNDALAAYEVIFKNGLAYYKSTNTLMSTWTGSTSRETLYVIDGRDNKIYLVNVDGRYIQVRGSANCVGQTIPQNQSTAGCTKPRLTTHAGILMGSIAGLPSPNKEPGTDVQKQIRVVGAGTILVTDGAIQWISNDSGHFQPTQDNLKTSIAAFKSAGFPNFPPRGDCGYKFYQPDPVNKPKVYRQDKVTTDHCEL